MKNKGKSLTIVLTVIYLLIVVWIILFKMATLSEIVYSDGIRNINLIPFHYDKEAPFHRSEIIKKCDNFYTFGCLLKNA